MRALSLLLLTWVPALILAQGPAHMVPENSTIVVALNGESITSKVSVESFEKYKFYKEIEKNMIRSSKKEIDGFSLKDLGMNFKNSSYYFLENNDSVMYNGFVAPLSSASSFGGFVENILISRYNKDYKVLQGKNFTYIQTRDNLYAWNDKVGVIIESDLNRSYFYRNPDIYARYNLGDGEDEWASQSKIEKQWLSAKGSQLFKMSSKIASRLEGLKSKGDVVMWSASNQNLTDYAGLGRMYKMNKDYEGFMKKLQEYTEGNESVVALNFNDGQLHVRSDAKMNDRSYELMSKLTKAKMNKNFLRYVRGDQLIGYYGISLNLKELIPAAKDFYEPLAKEFPEYGQMSIDVVDLVDIVLDEEALFEVWNGQLLAACTGVRKFESTYYSYEYDENFEMIKVPHIKEETLPEMVILLGTENEEAIQKIYRILEKSAGVVNKGNYWEMPSNRDLPFTMYLGVHDGVVCLSNDKEIVANMKEGVNNPVSGKQAKMIKKHQFSMFFDGKKLMSVLPKDELVRGKSLKMYDLAQQNVTQLYVMRAKGGKNAYSAEGYIETKDGVNSLKFALDLIEEFYVLEKGPR